MVRVEIVSLGAGGTTRLDLSSRVVDARFTSHSAYDATLTKSNGVKIDGFLYPNIM